MNPLTIHQSPFTNHHSPLTIKNATHHYIRYIVSSSSSCLISSIGSRFPSPMYKRFGQLMTMPSTSPTFLYPCTTPFGTTTAFGSSAPTKSDIIELYVGESGRLSHSLILKFDGPIKQKRSAWSTCSC